MSGIELRVISSKTVSMKNTEGYLELHNKAQFRDSDLLGTSLAKFIICSTGLFEGMSHREETSVWAWLVHAAVACVRELRFARVRPSGFFWVC